MKCWMQKIVLLLIACSPLALLPARQAITDFKQFVNCLDDQHEAALHRASPAPRVTQALLKAGAYVDVALGLNYTPLHYAAFNGNYLSALILLSYGAQTKGVEAQIEQRRRQETPDGNILEGIFIMKVVLARFAAFKKTRFWISGGTAQVSGAQVCDAFLNYLAGKHLQYPKGSDAKKILKIVDNFACYADSPDENGRMIIDRAITEGRTALSTLLNRNNK